MDLARKAGGGCDVEHVPGFLPEGARTSSATIGRQIWRRSGLAVAFLGLALVVAPGLIAVVKTPRLLPNAAPFLVLLAVWLVSFLVLRARNQQYLQREIDELNALERENR